MTMDPTVRDLQEQNTSFFWKLLLAHEKKYDSELERLISFSVPRPWPHKFLSPRSFTRCGFYYTGSKDIVKCHFCKQTASGWGIGDRPEEEHLEFSSRCICPLQHGFQTDNIPIPDDLAIDIDGHAQNGSSEMDLNSEFLYENTGASPNKYQFQYSPGNFNDVHHLHFYFHPDQIYTYGYSDRQSQNNNNHNNFSPNNNNNNSFGNKNKKIEPIVIISTNGGPKCKDFITISSRLETFKAGEVASEEDQNMNMNLKNEMMIWDESKKPPAEMMALLGFFWSENKQVVCYHCAGILEDENWTKDEKTCDPYEEHQKLYPECLLSHLPKLKTLESSESPESFSFALENQNQNQMEENSKSEEIHILEKTEEIVIEDETEKTMEQKKKKKKKDDGTLTPDPTSLQCKMCKCKTMTTVLVKCGHMVACDLCVRNIDYCPECDSPAPYIVRIPKPLTI